MCWRHFHLAECQCAAARTSHTSRAAYSTQHTYTHLSKVIIYNFMLARILHQFNARKRRSHTIQLEWRECTSVFVWKIHKFISSSSPAGRHTQALLQPTHARIIFIIPFFSLLPVEPHFGLRLDFGWCCWQWWCSVAVFIVAFQTEYTHTHTLWQAYTCSVVVGPKHFKTFLRFAFCIPTEKAQEPRIRQTAIKFLANVSPCKSP